MCFIIKIVILVALVKLLMATNKPLLCAGIYAGIGLLLGLGMGIPVFPAAAGIDNWICTGLGCISICWTVPKEAHCWWVILIGGIVDWAGVRRAAVSNLTFIRTVMCWIASWMPRSSRA